MNESEKEQAPPDSNPDPITGAPGAHPVGVGLGSAGGAAVGAALGSFVGALGTALGAAIGGVAGGLTGKGVAEKANPTVEDHYWRDQYASRPYVAPGAPYDEYEPAYRFGWESRDQDGELDWEKAEPRLRADWLAGGTSPLDWDKASPAVRDAWERLHADDGDESI